MATSFSTQESECIERLITDARCDNQLNLSNFDDVFDIQVTCAWIKKNQFNRICLQFPDYLLKHSSSIYHKIQKQFSSLDIYILGDTSYASCCIDDTASRHVSAEGVVQYGHSCLSETNFKVLRVPLKTSLDIEDVFKKLETSFDSNSRLCLFYDIGFQHIADKLTHQLFQRFPNSYATKIAVNNTHADHVLNRQIINRNEDIISPEELKSCNCIFIGPDNQVMFNCVISVEAKEWHHYNNKTSSIVPVEQTAWLKRRRYLIEKCKDAKNVGILVCLLSGKTYEGIIDRVREMVKAHGKKCYIISVGKPNVAKLANFSEIDIYVMVACPENELYSCRDFYKPIVYPYEMEIALNPSRPNVAVPHVVDFNDILPGGRRYYETTEVMNAPDVSLITGLVRGVDMDESSSNTSTDISSHDKVKWAVERSNIGTNLLNRNWAGLEQKLGETDVKLATKGRKGIATSYDNGT